MTRYYTAYLLRHWRQTSGREWVEVQHVATGERHRFSALADAYAWLQGQVRAPTGDAPDGPTEDDGAQARAAWRCAGRIDDG